MFGPCIVMHYLVLILVFILRKRKLVTLLLLSNRCIVTVNVLWLFPTVSWVRLQCVIVVFPDHTLLLFKCPFYICNHLAEQGQT